MLKDNPFRLSKNIKPLKYDLFLDTDLKSGKFSGELKIDLNIEIKTHTISINSIDLDLKGVSLQSPNQNITPTTIKIDRKHEMIHFIFSELLKPGSACLHIDFNGKLNSKLKGFYKSTFLGEDGKTQILGTTQFESTDARRAFPCFDEPEFKAIFSISLKLDKRYKAISNSSIEKETLNSDGTKLILFKDTIKMSTYLVAFIIGSFEETTPVFVNDVPIKIISVKGKKKLTNYALNCARYFLEYFNNYYGQNYPGHKLDLVAIPDFASGAMENLGCITFRETLLLVDEKRATEPELSRIADVIAHEIAHMWFGDLVTMKWWNGIWLNEAFATFMATKAVDKFKPEWERWVQFGFERSAAFDVDSLEQTRPIEYEVLSPDDASGMFDLLTYEKGGSVLRMLEQYLGEDIFQKGVQKYLEFHKFSNTETEDLWESLEKTANQPVRAIMDSWIFQPGFPKLFVSVDNEDLRIEQTIFRYKKDSTNNQLWSIPIILKTWDNNTENLTKKLMRDNILKLKVNNSENNSSLINVGGYGFYRVQYSKTLSDNLLKNMSSKQEKISKIERFCFLDDYWSNVLSKNYTVDSFLGNLKYFKDEECSEVLDLIISCLSSLERLVEKDQEVQYRSFVHNFFNPLLLKTGLHDQENESNKNKEFRASLLRAMGNLSANKQILKHCNNLFVKYKNNPNLIEANILAASISVLAKYGGKDRYLEFLSLYNNSSTPQEEMRFLFSLSLFPNKQNFLKTLNLAMSSKVRTQNGPYLIGQTLRHPKFYSLAWEFVEENWKSINKKFPENSIPRLLTGIRTITDPNIANQIQSFFSTHKVPQGQKTLDQHLEKMIINVNFADFNLKYLKKFLANYKAM